MAKKERLNPELDTDKATKNPSGHDDLGDTPTGDDNVGFSSQDDSPNEERESPFSSGGYAHDGRSGSSDAASTGI